MRSREGLAPARHAVIAMVFLAGAVALGGGGSPNPGTEIWLQLLFVAAALAWLWVPGPDGRVPVPRSRAFWLVCALILALPIAQLIPLPTGIWTRLPGQEDRIAALALVGREQSWQPISQSPLRTLAGLLAILPALFACFAAASLDSRGRRWLVATICVMAIGAALLGALQLSFGREGPYLYAESHRPFVTGFQANRNAAADVLLIGMAATAAWLAPWLAGARSARGASRTRFRAPDRGAAALVLVGTLTVLFFATVFTASRTGIALVPLALLAVWAIVRPSLADLGRVRHIPALVGLTGVVLVAAWALLGDNAALGSVVERFAFSGDYRRELWRDGWFAAERAWPVGIGLGGAQSALIAVERLEVLDSMLPNRVHNDYLELMLEGGLLALVLLVTLAAVLSWAAWRAWRERPEEHHVTLLGATMIAIVAVHSLVDYPLRSMALACLAGAGAGFLLAGRRTSTLAATDAGERRK